MVKLGSKVLNHPDRPSPYHGRNDQDHYSWLVPEPLQQEIPFYQRQGLAPSIMFFHYTKILWVRQFLTGIVVLANLGTM